MERLTASAAVENLRNEEFSVEQLCRALLAREKARPAVKAWAHLDENQIISEARRLDGLPPSERGPLHGLPVGVKDLYGTKDMPTRYGSPRYAGGLNLQDASLVSILRRAGCLIMGKTVTTEFAVAMNGIETTNPHDRRYSPGSSSSGSAAAVADYEVPLAIGTQTLGSVVRPASFCGVYGYKPTHGTLSMAGCYECSPSLDTVGFFSRSVADLQMLAGVLKIADLAPVPLLSEVRGARLAYCKTGMWPKRSTPAEEALELAIKLLRGAGGLVEELVLPPDFDKVYERASTVMARDVAVSMQDEVAKGQHDLDAGVMGFIHKGLRTSWENYGEALDALDALRPLFDQLARPFDAVLSLSAQGEAPESLERGNKSCFCVTWSALHVPCVNLVGFGGPQGLPIGLTLVAPRWYDAKLLCIAKAVSEVFEAGGNWKSRL